MAQVRMQITKDGVSGTLFLGVGRDHTWHLEKAVPWFEGTSGKWGRRTNATKFRQFSFIELVNTGNVSVARMKDFPFQVNERFQANLVARLWILETSGEPFDVYVQQAPPPTKKFRIRESWGGALSYIVGQGEVCGFEIFDTTTNANANYVYHGVGISIGLPIKKLPNTIPGVSTAGPWNDFDAPGWMTVHDFGGDATLQSGNVALGTSYSLNVFDFAGHVDNYPGFLVHLPDLQTGRTIGLPSAGFSSGSMSEH